ncbi:hypothetical protein EVAR_33676_1 [Eumeta japonica]|uniref:Uncharacterized protein n=1 Tax=Eumeta variegata TaxID=151549 RepID=A0A4C1VNJ7_EUMVA|nr:hypothetical protein EVAR_33676_1 [Eumeta japonica]
MLGYVRAGENSRKSLQGFKGYKAHLIVETLSGHVAWVDKGTKCNHVASSMAPESVCEMYPSTLQVQLYYNWNALLAPSHLGEFIANYICLTTAIQIKLVLFETRSDAEPQPGPSKRLRTE